MCDTLYAPRGCVAAGRALFAKNSDRERNEAQSVEFWPGRPAEAGRVRRATFIGVPDPDQTLPCVLSRPFWGFGAEMGVNCRGVAIGNEALMSAPDLEPPSRRGGLTGMDLVRLALERAASAHEALDVLTGLLEAYGQGGDCGHLSRFYYHNSFLIADPSEGFVLETLGRDWAAERITGPCAISNAYAIGRPTAGASAALEALARSLPPGIDLGERLQDRARAALGQARERARGGALRMGAGVKDALALMAALRDHGPQTPFDPAASRAKTVCMHAGARGRRSQTVGSMVCDLDTDGGVVWTTAAAAPCLCVFRPLWLDVAGDLLGEGHRLAGARGAGPEDDWMCGPTPGAQADDASRWWRHEGLHRPALDRFPAALARFAPARDALEADIAAEVDALRGAPASDRSRAQARWWAMADALEAAVLSQAAQGPPPDGEENPRGAYARSWSRLSGKAGLDI